MNTEVTHQLVRRVARACRWPPVTVGALIITDRGAWEYAIDRAVPVELVRLIGALAPHMLTVTDGGRARLARQHQPARDADEEPYVVGDSEALPLVRAALALVPSPVRFAMQREVAFLAVGTSSGAWTGSASFVDNAGVRKETVIVLGPEMSVAIVLHELGHAFTRPVADEISQAISVQGEEGFRTYMLTEGAIDRLKKWDRESEAIADGLALAWLYSEPAGTRPA